MKINRLYLPIAVVSIWASVQSSSLAASLFFSGNFNTSYNTGAGRYQGVSQFDGSWSFSFDDSVVSTTSSGFQTFDVSGISFTSTDSSMSWVAPSAIARLTYTNSGGMVEFDDLIIAGSPSGAEFIDTAEDDFHLSYEPNGVDAFTPVSGNLTNTFLSSQSATFSQTGRADSGSFIVTSVPEPSSTMLLTVSCLSLALRRKR